MNAYEQLAERVRDTAYDQIKGYVRAMLGDMKPADPNDWAAIDKIMAALSLLQVKADSAYNTTLIKAMSKVNDKDALDALYHASVYRAAVSTIIVAHAEFVIEGKVYRDRCADWYADRLYNAIEHLMSESVDERNK